MSVPARLEIPDEVLEIARTLEAAGSRGVVRGRRAARLAARRSSFRHRLRHLGPARGRAPALPPYGGSRDQVRHRRRARPESGPPRGHDLPPRRVHRRAPCGGGVRRLAGGGSRPARLHHQRDRVPSAPRRVARSATAARTISTAGSCAPSGTRRSDFGRTTFAILRAVRFAARFGFAVDPATWAGRAARRHPGWRASPPSGCGTSGSRAWRPRRTRPSWCGSGSRWVPRRSGSRSCSASERTGRPARGARRGREIRCASRPSSPRSPSLALRRLKASNAETARAPARSSADRPRRRTAPRQRCAAMAGDGRRPPPTIWWPCTCCDTAASRPGRLSFARSRERGDPVSRSQLAIDGRDVQALGISGRRVGDVLAELLDRVLADPALNTRETLLALAREIV